MPRPAKLQPRYKKKDQVKFNQVSMNDDKNCQSNVCSDKNCQDTKFMQPVQQAMKNNYMQPLPRPKMLQSSYKKRKSVYDDQKCQSTVCSDKISQETQSINM